MMIHATAVWRQHRPCACWFKLIIRLDFSCGQGGEPAARRGKLDFYFFERHPTNRASASRSITAQSSPARAPFAVTSISLPPNSRLLCKQSVRGIAGSVRVQRGYRLQPVSLSECCGDFSLPAVADVCPTRRSSHADDSFRCTGRSA